MYWKCFGVSAFKVYYIVFIFLKATRKLYTCFKNPSDGRKFRIVLGMESVSLCLNFDSAGSATWSTWFHIDHIFSRIQVLRNNNSLRGINDELFVKVLSIVSGSGRWARNKSFKINKIKIIVHKLNRCYLKKDQSKKTHILKIKSIDEVIVS